MALLKTTLSKHAREQLALASTQPWFQEMMETLRNIAGSLEQGYSANRPISELEHQALNGSFRRGAATLVEAIPMLFADPKEKPTPLSEPFGKLQPQTPDPKALPLNKNPQ